jgi:hypothetical protein
MHWTIKCARFLLLLMPALALGMPAFAQSASGRDPTLSDSQEPGSVIVFPKFIRGAVTGGVDGVTTPQTEIEYTVQCPSDLEDTCPLHMPVMVRFHWVCPGSPAICKETDFFIPSTVNEKVVLTPDGVSYPGVTSPGTGQLAPMAECPRGYLIGWVVNPTTLLPIRFDGLIGDAVLRVSGTAVAAYNAIPIQAAPGTQGGLITLGTGGALVFDGLDNHYQAVTGAIQGDVKYIRQVGTGGTFNDTFLTLLTLDVRSNRPNDQVFVDIEFYGGFGSLIGNENELSTSVSFVCWQEFQLDNDIDLNLNQAFMGRKGTFESDVAMTAGGVNVTLLGLVEVDEGPMAEPLNRSYITPVFNDSVPVPTSFVPHN